MPRTRSSSHSCKMQAPLWLEKQGWDYSPEKKNNIFPDSWGQWVSQGVALVAKGFTQGGLCHFMDAHLSTVRVFQRDSGHNVFLCTFPIMVAQICLTNHSSSCLPSLVTQQWIEMWWWLQLGIVRNRGGGLAGRAERTGLLPKEWA